MTGYLLIYKNVKRTNFELDKNVTEQPRWRRRPELRPDAILDGALVEFRDRGFVGARIEDIAKRAGLSKGSVYLYFSSKEEMLEALIRRSVVPIATSLKNIADHINDDNFNEPASVVLRKMLSIVGENLGDKNVSAIPLLIIGEAGSFPEHAAFYRDEVIEVTMKALSSVIQRGVQANEFKKIEVKYAVRSLMSIVIMQTIWDGVFAHKDDANFDWQEMIDTHLNIFLNGVMTPKE